ncbi:MAG: hypothetical protein HYX92_01125 [Chloroflexi bacterium]|nr:hypothetical protein [Chloroflexota bacterium]
MYEVVSPLGEAAIDTVSVARGLLDLNGKTIGEVWNGGYRGELTFPIIRELLRRRYPDVKFVPYTEFPIQDIHGSTAELHGRAEAAAAIALEKGCDALITGNGF